MCPVRCVTHVSDRSLESLAGSWFTFWFTLAPITVCSGCAAIASRAARFASMRMCE